MKRLTDVGYRGKHWWGPTSCRIWRHQFVAKDREQLQSL